MRDNINHNRPIGVFDSGVGGLTVLKALRAYLPYEDYLYLGDTARLPYGIKSAETVQSYALQAADILHHRGVKALVVACNTASSVALEALQQSFQSIPVIGVVLPGAKACVEAAPHGRIAVIATESTVSWGAYPNAIFALNPQATVIQSPCSLLVPLVEEGWIEGELVGKIVEKCLAPLLEKLAGMPPDCLLLGCTHFPLLKNVIEKVIGPHITIIDSADATARVLHKTLLQTQALCDRNAPGKVHFLATDGLSRFEKVAKIFLKEPILSQALELVSLSPKDNFDSSKYQNVGVT
ncbi:MAG TPA: glutamate racemase, partial [Gammaproteobacteria bacterium]|nr:glutamate racemase [Gammaproteobacteria bacterium]